MKRLANAENAMIDSSVRDAKCKSEADRLPQTAPLSRSKVIAVALIILFGVAARCYHLRAPMMEVHSARQYDTAAIARNFYEGSMNILYPQIDWRGTSPGYVESEFQIYSYSIALLYRVFGVHEWLGRALNISFYALSGILLFQFARRIFDDTIALLALLFFTVVPLTFLFTRTFQPDALLMLGSLAAIYYFWLWTEDAKNTHLALSALGLAVAVLIKPPSVYLAVPLLYLAYRKFRWAWLRKPELWAFGAVALLPSLLWYAHAAVLWQRYGNSLFRYFIAWGYPSFTDRIWLQLGKALLSRLTFQIATPLGLPLLAIGFFAKPPRRNYLLHAWAAGFAVYILAAPPNHAWHSYYQMPAVLLTATWMAFGALFLVRRRNGALISALIAVLCLSVIGTSMWMNHRMLRVSEWSLQRVVFGQRLQQITEPNALVLFLRPALPGWRPIFFEHRTRENTLIDEEPADLYLSHRKGWSLNEIEASSGLLQTLQKHGAGYVATYYPDVIRHTPELKRLLDQSWVPVEITPNWAIYKSAVSSSNAPASSFTGVSLVTPTRP